MFVFLRRLPLLAIALLASLALGLLGCSSGKTSATTKSTIDSPTTQATTPGANPNAPGTADKPGTPPVNGVQVPAAGPEPFLLGIDVLERHGFAVLQGKRVGLLTHQAGVNIRGESTIDVLRRAPGVKLVALYAVEHGLRGELPAEKTYNDQIDPKTGLMVYSLYNGKSRWASPAQLKTIDVLVIDLQDIGSRSYTYVSAMRYALESCFKAGKDVVVLDRPNPLGGLKVDGPPLDSQWTSYVGAFRVPYVHGLTIGELARMAKEAPGVLQIPDEVRERGRLTIIPMQGWKRSMRWPDTGLRWVPTSPMVQDYSAVMGYAMTGLGCYLGNFRHGVGDQHAFRGIYHKTVPSDVLEQDLRAAHIPGIAFRKISVPNKQGKAATGIYVEITDWDEWNPTELSFHLMRLACKYEHPNPFVATHQGIANGFLRHMGCTDFFEALKRDGAQINLAPYLADWKQRCQIYQQQVKKYWLYQ